MITICPKPIIDNTIGRHFKPSLVLKKLKYIFSISQKYVCSMVMDS